MRHKLLQCTILFFAALLFSGLCIYAQAGDLEDGVRYLKSGQDEKAFTVIKWAAEKGNAIISNPANPHRFFMQFHQCFYRLKLFFRTD